MNLQPNSETKTPSSARRWTSSMRTGERLLDGSPTARGGWQGEAGTYTPS